MKLTCLALALTLCLLTGCNNTYELEDRWKPLESIVERTGGDKWITTIGKHVYVSNLDEFFKRNPENSIKLESVLSHELVHSWRQYQFGINKWLVKYLTNREFRLREEVLAYYVDFIIEGLSIDRIVSKLLKYSPSMGTQEKIEAAVEDVFNNPPAKEEYPPQLRHLIY